MLGPAIPEEQKRRDFKEASRVGSRLRLAAGSDIPSGPLHPMDSVLALADELERRDAEIALRLEAVEERQREVEVLRDDAVSTAEALALLPAERAKQADDETAAREARARALAELREAEQREDPLAVDRARITLDSAEHWVAETEAQRERLLVEELNARARAAATMSRAAELGLEVPNAATETPAALAALDEWASRERGALLLEHSGLVRERDAVVREASELLASVLGEPFASTSVAGLRGRLERGL
jgi:hypothetical protein